MESVFVYLNTPTLPPVPMWISSIIITLRVSHFLDYSKLYLGTRLEVNQGRIRALSQAWLPMMRQLTGVWQALGTTLLVMVWRSGESIFYTSTLCTGNISTSTRELGRIGCSWREVKGPVGAILVVAVSERPPCWAQLSQDRFNNRIMQQQKETQRECLTPN